MSSPSEPSAHDRVRGDRDVDGVALVGAGRGRRAADEEVGDDVVVGDVPAHRDVGLVQRDRAAGVGQGDPAEADHDVPVAREQVDALERVVRVADDRLGLLDPVERCPLDDDPTAQVGVVRGERRPPAASGHRRRRRRTRPGVWCHAEVHRAEHRGQPVGHLGCRARHERGARRRRAARRTWAPPGAAPRPARHPWCRARARRRARRAPAGSPARTAARRAGPSGVPPCASPSPDAPPPAARGQRRRVAGGRRWA